MALTYGFYNSFAGDRKYDAMQVSELFDGIIADGIIASQGQHFAVTAGGGMTVNVGTGRAWFFHTWTKNDSALVLSVPASDISRVRIDAVVLEVNREAAVRANSIKIVQGEPLVNGVKPALVTTDKIHQYPLAYITVGAGVEEIKAENIENAIGLAATPFATGVLETTPIDDLWSQWEGEWDTWFSAIKLQLSSNVVTNLQLQIDELRKDKVNVADKASPVEAVTGTNDSKWMTPATTKSALTSGMYIGGVKYATQVKELDLGDKALYSSYSPYHSAFANANSAVWINDSVYIAWTESYSPVRSYVSCINMLGSESYRTFAVLSITNTYDGVSTFAFSGETSLTARVTSFNVGNYKFIIDLSTYGTITNATNPYYYKSGATGYLTENYILWKDSNGFSVQHYGETSINGIPISNAGNVSILGNYNNTVYMWDRYTKHILRVNLASRSVSSQAYTKYYDLKPVCRIGDNQYILAYTSADRVCNRFIILNVFSASLEDNSSGTLSSANFPGDTGTFLCYTNTNMYFVKNDTYMWTVNRNTLGVASLPLFGYSGDIINNIVRNVWVDYGPAIEGVKVTAGYQINLATGCVTRRVLGPNSSNVTSSSLFVRSINTSSPITSVIDSGCVTVRDIHKIVAIR